MSITGSNNPFACEPVVFANANAIVSLGTITREGNEFTFSVGFVWKINGVTYQNTAPIVLTIAEASEGFNRIDNALLNTSNSIELQQGLESETIALRPTFPDNNILLTSWNISGDAIGDTETPIVGTQFKKKDESQKITQVLGGTDAEIELRTFGQQYYEAIGPVTSVAGFSMELITANPGAEAPYSGKDFFFENNTDHNVTLKNEFSPVDIPFNFGADLVVPIGGKVWMKYYTTGLELVMKSWSDFDLSTKADLVDGKVPASQLPSYVDDVLEFADLASFPVTGETGIIYVALDTNYTYRWSGSAYIQISTNPSQFCFELPFFFYNRYVSTNFTSQGTSVGYLIWNIDAGTTNHLALVPSGNTACYRVPRACELDRVYFYGNSSTHEIAIYKSPTANGASAVLVYHGSATGGIDVSNIAASIPDGYFLHLFFRNTLGAAGTNNGRLFLTFK